MDADVSSFDRKTLHQLSDEEVLAALRGGNLDGLEVLYGRYATPVYSLAYRILGSKEEAEDLTQDIFVSLWQTHHYQRSRGRLKPFVMTLTRSRSIDRLRRRGTQQRFLQRWQRVSPVATAEPTMDTLSAHEDASLVQDALASLSDSERQVLECAYYEGRSQAKIAEWLQLPLGTVKSRSRSALKKLRQYLQDKDAAKEPR